MEGMDVSYGSEGRTLRIWFDHPWKAARTERRGEDLVLKKDERGRLIGIERANYFVDDAGGLIAPPAPGEPGAAAGNR